MINTISRTLTLLLLTLSTFSLLMAGGPLKTGKKHIVYTYQSGDGTNASAVVWIPGKNYYVTAIAGNSDFPMEAFSEIGAPVWQGSVGIDVRGMWWNAKSARLEANAAGEEGWYSVALNDQSAPTQDWSLVTSGQHQPDFQSVLTRTPKNVVGYDNGNFYFYDVKKGKLKKTVPLTGVNSNWDLNYTTVAYTGNSAYPLALYDYNGASIRYFDLAGKYLDFTELPDGAPMPDAFRFSFANGYAWLYDADSRKWTSYQVFN